MVIKFFNYLRSVQFFILTLTLLGIAAILGIIIPQGWEHHLYLKKYGKIIAYLLIKARWHQIFSSLWFIIPLTAFSLNLLLCIFSRSFSLLHTLFMSPIETVKGVESDRTRIALKEDIPLDDALLKLKNILKARNFTIHSKHEKDTIHIAARKNMLGILGSLLLHFGLLFLVAGGIIQHYRGDTSMAVLSKGAKTKIEKFNIQLQMRKFSIVKNKKGDLINYQTDMKILDTAGNMLKVGNTAVNSPLRFKDLYFYQVQYKYIPDVIESFQIVIIDSMNNDTIFEGHVPYKKKFNINRQDISLFCDAFFCDFVFDIKSRIAFNRSDQRKNPAFKVAMFKKDSLINSQWIFINFPSPHGSHGRYNCAIVSYDPSFYSGIEIRKKPGTPFIWTAIIVISTGLLLVFLFPFRELYLILKPEQNQISLAVTPVKPRGAEWFDKEAEELISRWKEGI